MPHLLWSNASEVAAAYIIQVVKDWLYVHFFLAFTELDSNFSESGRARCAEAIEPLISAVDSLVTFVSSPDFYSVKAKIPPHARAAQEPISSAGKSIIRGSCSMLESAKLLAVNPKDPPTWQNLAGHSKSVSDAIKKLVHSIR